MSSKPLCPPAHEAEEAQHEEHGSGPHETVFVDSVVPAEAGTDENGHPGLPVLPVLPPALQNSAASLDIATIRPMPAESVRRIVAGQAIYDLASCTKELIDNALDAGSKNINSELLTYFFLP